VLPVVDFPTLGWVAIDWIEAYLPHGPGDVQGEPIVLDDELATHLLWAYRLHPKTGRRVVFEDWFSRPKGRAKSEFAAEIVCFEALGPCRFDGWGAERDEFGNRIPIGRPVRSPFIRILATEEGQTGNTYDNVEFMLTRGPAVDEFPGLEVGRTRTMLPGGGGIFPSTASSASKDGGKETFGVADEPHLYVLRELRQMHRTVMRNLAKRKDAEPWMLNTTTMFQPGEGSVAESAHERWLKRGKTPLGREGMLYDHREAPHVENWNDDRELKRALAEGYGPFAEVLDLDRIVADIRNDDATEAESRRYWLNQRARASGVWRANDHWDEREVARQLNDEESICVGFDGSRFHDATGLVACTVDDFVVPLAFWEKQPDDPPSWEVHSEDVLAELVDIFERYDVVRLYGDPFWWGPDLDAWAARWSKQRVFKWATNEDTKMAAAVRAFTTAVRTGSISHDGDPDLARHIANAYEQKVNVRTEGIEAAYVLGKERKGSPRKMDLAVCTVLGKRAKDDALAAGEFEADAVKRRRRAKRSRTFHSF
jgi:hypothetical protein